MARRGIELEHHREVALLGNANQRGGFVEPGEHAVGDDEALIDNHVETNVALFQELGSCDSAAQATDLFISA